jgi:hypothetical protein
MHGFRFAKKPRQANDQTRRYRLLRGEEQEHVGEVEIGGDAPDGDEITLSVTCLPTLSGEEREVALGAAKRFVDELASGWGLQVAEMPGGAWVEQSEGTIRIRLDSRVVCANS